jgi:uncharacterized protein (TIGR00730 family)
MEMASHVGRRLAERGITVVYGGGKVGTMGAVADAALKAGGDVIGVIPDRLQALEVGHDDLTELYVVDSMSSRKTMMIHLSDAFIALPGGFGTLEEFSETVSLAVLNYNDKPTGLLNTLGFYDKLLGFLQTAEHEGFIRPGQSQALVHSKDIDDLVDILAEVRIPGIAEWLPALQKETS